MPARKSGFRVKGSDRGNKKKNIGKPRRPQDKPSSRKSLGRHRQKLKKRQRSGGKQGHAGGVFHGVEGGIGHADPERGKSREKLRPLSHEARINRFSPRRLRRNSIDGQGEDFKGSPYPPRDGELKQGRKVAKKTVEWARKHRDG